MSWDLAPQMACFRVFSSHILPLLSLLFGMSELEENGELKVRCNKLYWQHNGLS